MSEYLTAWIVYLSAFAVFWAVLLYWLWPWRSKLWCLSLLSMVFCFNLVPVLAAEGVYAPFLAGFAVDVIAGKLSIAKYVLSFAAAVAASAVMTILLRKLFCFVSPPSAAIVEHGEPDEPITKF